MPSLIRTLGPAVVDLPGKRVAAERRRLEVTERLIDHLPAIDVFSQQFDPRITDAPSFLYRGFHLSSPYSFRAPAGLSETQLWNGMNDKTRNGIRKAEQQLRVGIIDDVERFVRFHDE